MTTPSPNRTRFARRLHSRVAYDPGANSSAQDDHATVVLLHDLLADRTAWSVVREVLSRHYRVVIPEARGHGASPTLTNQWYTVAELAADVLAVLDTESLSHVHVVGCGLGGTTALELALRSPDRVLSVTLIDPSVQVLAGEYQDPVARSDVHQRQTTDRAAADAAYKLLFDRALDTYWLPRRGTNWRETFTKQQVSAVRRHAPALAALLPALDAYTVDVAAVRAMTCPTLVVASETASRLDRMSTARLSELLPHPRIETHSESSTNLEATNALGRLIDGFIDKSSHQGQLNDQSLS